MIEVLICTAVAKNNGTRFKCESLIMGNIDILQNKLNNFERADFRIHFNSSSVL